MSKQFDKKFKEDAVRYYFDHKDLGLKGCAEKLGVSRTALSVWAKAANEKLEILKKAIGILGN